MIKGFNGIRGIAVLLVMFNHFGLINYNPFGIDISSVCSGTTGVYIFFGLSGFLITKILINEYQATNRINIKNFLMRRFLRLLPAMLVYLIVLVLLMFFALVPYNWPSIFYALTYTTNFSLRKHFSPLLYHFWSLSVEEHFYLFYPLLFKLNKKKSILYILLGLIIISLLVKILQVNYILYVKQLTENYRWTIPSILPILTGAVMIILLTKKSMEEILKKYRYLLLIVGLLFFANELLITNTYFFKLGLNYLVQSTGISFLITYIYLNQESRLLYLLDFKVLAFIGQISYGLYIWHVLFSEFVLTGHLNLVSGIVLSFVVPVISYFTVEKYFLQKKSSFKYAS